MVFLVGAIIGITLWWMGKRLENQSKQPTWDADFCVIPGVDERCFIYEYDLPTPERHDAQFWEMVDFINEQAALKQRRLA